MPRARLPCRRASTARSASSLLEKAPKAQRGGNTHFSGAIFRFVFDKVEQLDRFVPDAEKEYPGFHAGVPVYPREAFREDLMRVTEGKSDPELADLMIDASYDTTCWLQDVGKHEFELARSVMGIKVGNQIKWPRGAIVRTVHEGVGLSATWFKTAEAMNVEIRYDSHVLELTQSESGRVNGVVVRGPDGVERLAAKAVVLACGGFETNPAWRTHYLGQEWGHAKVRGSNFNYGDGLKMALDMGAMPWGHWGGCHATPIVADAPDYGKREMTDKTNRLSYLYGVMLNVEGRRWIDEGADFNSFTYAKYGGLILKQPKGVVYQIFDSKVMDLLEPRYKTSEPFKSDTLEGLVKQLKIDQKQAMKTLERIQRRVRPRRTVQSGRARRPAYRRHRAAENQLGAEARHAAVLFLGGDGRHHVHVRRPQDQQGSPGDFDRLEADGGLVCRRRNGGRTFPLQLSRSAPGSCPARSSAASRDAARRWRRYNSGRIHSLGLVNGQTQLRICKASERPRQEAEERGKAAAQG